MLDVEVQPVRVRALERCNTLSILEENLSKTAHLSLRGKHSDITKRHTLDSINQVSVILSIPLQLELSTDSFSLDAATDLSSLSFSQEHINLSKFQTKGTLTLQTTACLRDVRLVLNE